jgi:hypothetical protein
VCVEPDFSTDRARALCAQPDAGAVLVQMHALWLIATCRKVRLRARCLITSAGVLPRGRLIDPQHGQVGALCWADIGRCRTSRADRTTLPAGSAQTSIDKGAKDIGDARGGGAKDELTQAAVPP